MDYFAGLDVSVKETSVCIVDDAGKIVREARVVRADPVRGAAAYLFRAARLPDRFREQPMDHPFDLALRSALREAGRARSAA
jgi:hypothetical protein